MPPLTLSSPTIVHHMAAMDPPVAPPNSLAAIEHCLRHGAAFVEVDVTALAERDYLIVHDPNLQAETSGQGPVNATLPEAVGSLFLKYGGENSTHPPALLSQVVELFQMYPGPTRLQLDYKNVIPFPSDEPLQRLIGLIQPLGERVLVSSGADWQLRRLRKLAPWLMLGFDIMGYLDWQPAGKPRDPQASPRQLGAYGYYDDHVLAANVHWPAAEYLRDRCEVLMSLVPGVSVFYLEHPLIAQSLRDGFNWAEALHERGIKLDAWTMDVVNPTVVENAPLLLKAGVDLFTSNTPRALAQLLGLSQPA